MLSKPGESRLPARWRYKLLGLRNVVGHMGSVVDWFCWYCFVPIAGENTSHTSLVELDFLNSSTVEEPQLYFPGEFWCRLNDCDLRE